MSKRKEIGEPANGARHEGSSDDEVGFNRLLFASKLIVVGL